jgi:replicative DNA helicase
MKNNAHFPLISCNQLLDGLADILSSQSPPCSTGIAPLDAALSGGIRDQLVIVGGLPGSGKTDIAVNFALSIARTRPVLYLSFELSCKQLLLRLLSCSSAKQNKATALTEQDIYGCGYDPALQERLFNATEGMASISCNIFFADAVAQSIEVEHFITIEDLRRAVAFQKERTGIAPAVIVDYLQEFTAGNDHGTTSTDTLDYLSRHLAAMAHSDETPVIALSSMAKDGTFRGSAHISHAADIALVLESSDKHLFAQPTRHIKLQLAKNRSGIAGLEVPLKYTPAYHVFE